MNLEQSSSESWLYDLSTTCQCLVIVNLLYDWSPIIGLKGLIEKLAVAQALSSIILILLGHFQIWISFQIKPLAIASSGFTDPVLMLCTHDKGSSHIVVAVAVLSKEVIKRDCLICLVRFSETSPLDFSTMNETENL